jgi:membrane associated rhomboid family serine protease
MQKYSVGLGLVALAMFASISLVEVFQKEVNYPKAIAGLMGASAAVWFLRKEGDKYENPNI